MLQDYDYNVIALGKTADKIGKTYIQTQPKAWTDIHTLTLYLNSANSSSMEDYILDLNPQRIIINPGAENLALEEAAKKKGIEVIRACTLVMLSTGSFESTTSMETT